MSVLEEELRKWLKEEQERIESLLKKRKEDERERYLKLMLEKKEDISKKIKDYKETLVKIDDIIERINNGELD